eukprot:6190476-Pleurochrysis_carterae.AAC.4
MTVPLVDDHMCERLNMPCRVATVAASARADGSSRTPFELPQFVEELRIYDFYCANRSQGDAGLQELRSAGRRLASAQIWSAYTNGTLDCRRSFEVEIG